MPLWNPSNRRLNTEKKKNEGGKEGTKLMLVLRAADRPWVKEVTAIIGFGWGYDACFQLCVEVWVTPLCLEDANICLFLWYPGFFNFEVYTADSCLIIQSYTCSIINHREFIFISYWFVRGIVKRTVRCFVLKLIIYNNLVILQFSPMWDIRFQIVVLELTSWVL